MFTGLIQKKGRLETIERDGKGTILSISHSPWETSIQDGESIAVNGVCFTVTHHTVKGFSCDALSETLSRTNISSKHAGAAVNLERSLKVGDLMGGHIVLGHVDATASVSSVTDRAGDRILRMECETGILEGMVMKGSIACDGVSLTISMLTGTFFEVSIIPATLEHTTLGHLVAGDMVNIETDVLGKYVRRYMEGGSHSSQLNLETLRGAGFLE
jgi:riboflavin synthase